MEQEFNVGLTNSKVYALCTTRCFLLCPAEVLTQMLRSTGHVTGFSIAKGCSWWVCHGQGLEVPIHGRLFMLLPSPYTSWGVKGDFQTIRGRSCSLRPEFLKASSGAYGTCKSFPDGQRTAPKLQALFSVLTIFIFVCDHRRP